MSQDWRAELLETIPYLRGASFVRKVYTAYGAEWHHDHCAVCGVKLAELGSTDSEVRHEGYATTSDYQHGEDYEWVCTECFEACKANMSWKDGSRT